MYFECQPISFFFFWSPLFSIDAQRARGFCVCICSASGNFHSHFFREVFSSSVFFGVVERKKLAKANNKNIETFQLYKLMDKIVGVGFCFDSIMFFDEDKQANRNVNSRETALDLFESEILFFFLYDIRATTLILLRPLDACQNHLFYKSNDIKYV